LATRGTPSRPASSRAFGFGPDARLKTRREIRRVYDEGRRVGGQCFLCFFLGDAGGDPPPDRSARPGRPRLGVTIVTKVGNAIVRNRLRRIVREFFRLRRAQMRDGFDVVVNARREAVDTATDALWVDLERIFARAGVLQGRTASMRTPGATKRRRDDALGHT
jgi:ribonuclease P protein component